MNKRQAKKRITKRLKHEKHLSKFVDSMMTYLVVESRKWLSLHG